MKKRQYVIKSVEFEWGDEYFAVYVPEDIPKDKVMEVFANALKYAGAYDPSLDEDEGIEWYDSFYTKTVEDGFDMLNGLWRFKSYIQDYYGWEVGEFVPDFEFKW